MNFIVDIISLGQILFMIVVRVDVFFLDQSNYFPLSLNHILLSICVIVVNKSLGGFELFSSILIAETHVLLILVLVFFNLVHLFSHDLNVSSSVLFGISSCVLFTVFSCILFRVSSIHDTIFEIDTIFDHESNNFFQTLNHELCLSVLFITLTITISTIELINFMVQFFFKIIEFEPEIVDDLCDLLFCRV